MGLGQMRTFRVPGSDRRQTPAFALVSHASYEDTQQLESTSLGTWLNTQLQQQAAALQAWRPTGEVNGKVERFRFMPYTGLGIVLPGSEIHLCRRKVVPNQGDDRSQSLHLVNACYRLTCVQQTG